jgi:hypothetical protein
MTPDELRTIMDFLRQRVHLKDPGTEGEGAIGFDSPSLDEMTGAGLDPDGSRQVREAPWWDEMVADIVETPELCEPGEPAAQVLEYAQDVVTDYIRKRGKREESADRLACAALGAREVPDHEPDHGKHEHQHDPEHFGSRGSFALNDVDDRPYIRDQD